MLLLHRFLEMVKKDLKIIKCSLLPPSFDSTEVAKLHWIDSTKRLSNLNWISSSECKLFPSFYSIVTFFKSIVEFLKRVLRTECTEAVISLHNFVSRKDMTASVSTDTCLQTHYIEYCIILHCTLVDADKRDHNFYCDHAWFCLLLWVHCVSI